MSGHPPLLLWSPTSPTPVTLSFSLRLPVCLHVYLLLSRVLVSPGPGGSLSGSGSDVYLSLFGSPPVSSLRSSVPGAPSSSYPFLCLSPAPTPPPPLIPSCPHPLLPLTHELSPISPPSTPLCPRSRWTEVGPRTVRPSPGLTDGRVEWVSSVGSGRSSKGTRGRTRDSSGTPLRGIFRGWFPVGPHGLEGEDCCGVGVDTGRGPLRRRVSGSGTPPHRLRLTSPLRGHRESTPVVHRVDKKGRPGVGP